jgi:hypothetical protein
MAKICFILLCLKPGFLDALGVFMWVSKLYFTTWGELMQVNTAWNRSDNLHQDEVFCRTQFWMNIILHYSKQKFEPDLIDEGEAG